MLISYRQLSFPDLELLQYTGRQTYEPYYAQVWKPGGLDWYMDHCFGTKNLKKDFEDPNIEYWLAAAETGQSIGFLKLVWKKPIPDYPAQEALYLEKIYLMPAFFGQGKGQELIRFALRRAVETGCSATWLQVMKSGPVWVYEQAGFKTAGEAYWDFELLKPEERAGWIMVCSLETV